MTEVLESLSKVEHCSICGDVADGYHYGVLSCRGCNAFFRRAVTHGMRFHCRRGGTCQVDKNARCACRACRLKKCEQMGMDRRAVQPKRIHESNQKSPMNSNSMSRRTTDSNNSPFYRSPSSQNSSLSEIVAQKSEVSSVSSFDDTISLPSTSREGGLIARLVDDYREQRERRRMMLCRCVEEILLDGLETTLRRPASGLDYVDIFKVQVVLMYEWVLRLEEFNAIEDPIDKSKLLRRFALRYMLLDNVFHAVELGIRDRIILVNNTYITPGDIPDVAPDESESSRTIKLLMYGERSIQVIDELIAPMVDMNFTVGELMALRLIMFWNPNGVSLSPQTKSIIQMASDRAVNELHRWYADQKFEAADTRLGNVLLLLSSITDQVHYMTEVVKLIPSFGALNERDSFLETVLTS